MNGTVTFVVTVFDRLLNFLCFENLKMLWKFHIKHLVTNQTPGKNSGFNGFKLNKELY